MYIQDSRHKRGWIGDASLVKLTVKKDDGSSRHSCAHCEPAGTEPYFMVEIIDGGKLLHRYDRCQTCLGAELVKEGLVW